MFIYSDIDIPDPGDYYGGFKEGRITRLGTASRSMSNRLTGDWTGSQFSFSVSDYDRSIRQRFLTSPERVWTKPLTVRMTNRTNRALLGAPYTVFNGVIVNPQPGEGLTWDITLSDFVSSRLLTDSAMIPWRMIRDGFLEQLTEVAEGLDRDMPEPIIYGKHLRIPDETPPVGAGFVYEPMYLGTWDRGGLKHVWLVAGHACASVGPLYLDNEVTAEGGDFLLPGSAGPVYHDLVSDTFGNTRRYTLVEGVVGSELADAVARGDHELAVAVEGVEPNGDGTGDVILDGFEQYKHFSINFLFRRGEDSYQSGPWLSNPVWDILFEDSPIPIVDEASFDEGSAIAFTCLDDGYIRACIIGARAGDRSTGKRWISEWNRSLRAQSGFTRYGQWKIALLHPTDAIKAAAVHYTAAYEILKDSFSPGDIGWQDHCNVLPARGDYEHVSGQWKTNLVNRHDASIADYGEIPGDQRDYPFAPGITHINHLAVLEGRVRAYPRWRIAFEATIGPDPVTLDSAAYRELGDYITYTHHGAIGTPDQIRLAQVEDIKINTATRKVQIIAFDCEDLIDFDAPDDGSPV